MKNKEAYRISRIEHLISLALCAWLHALCKYSLL